MGDHGIGQHWGLGLADDIEQYFDPDPPDPVDQECIQFATPDGCNSDCFQTVGIAIKPGDSSVDSTSHKSVVRLQEPLDLSLSISKMGAQVVHEHPEDIKDMLSAIGVAKATADTLVKSVSRLAVEQACILPLRKLCVATPRSVGPGSHSGHGPRSGGPGSYSGHGLKKATTSVGVQTDSPRAYELLPAPLHPSPPIKTNWIKQCFGKM